ncbi:transposase [Streptomyces sp. NPDC047009]|uniref:transposase n=1 Tax=unclassified Streptomyces TaxID=2593676 RepID=UPI00340A72C5
MLAPDERLKQLDRQFSDAVRTHPQAAAIESMPGMGPILGAEFPVAADDLAARADADHLASAAGSMPVAKDSGRRTGNLHRRQRYRRCLRRVFYPSAHTSIIRDGPNRTYYLKKRAEGHKHSPAAVSMSSGPSSATTAPSRHPADKDTYRHSSLTPSLRLHRPGSSLLVEVLASSFGFSGANGSRHGVSKNRCRRASRSAWHKAPAHTAHSGIFHPPHWLFSNW